MMIEKNLEARRVLYAVLGDDLVRCNTPNRVSYKDEARDALGVVTIIVLFDRFACDHLGDIVFGIVQYFCKCLAGVIDDKLDLHLGQ
jgi:hypothetical protein